MGHFMGVFNKPFVGLKPNYKSTLLRFAEFYKVENNKITDPKYRGMPNEVDFSTAISMAGEVQIELVEQHCENPSCYRDMFRKGQEGFHHIAVVCDDYWQEVER